MAINYNFEWDPIKAYDNRFKHRLSFEEAATIFKDSKAISIFDPDHSDTEERWITMGVSAKGRLLVVVHTFHEEHKDIIRIRIISCRKATKRETRTYGELK